MIEKGLAALLNADTRFSSIAASNLYPVVLPDDILNPLTPTPTSATYRVVSTVEEQTHDGPTGFVKVRSEYNTWATTYAASKELAVAIREVLNGYSSTLPEGTSVQTAWRDNSPDGFDEDSRLFRVQADYFVIFTETAHS